MSESTITYELLYDVLRKEKTRAELQKLEDSFYKEVTDYIKSKKEILSSQEKKESIFTTIEVQKTRKQIENVQKILKELYDKRETKIIQLAMMASRNNILTNDKGLMLEEEKKFYDNLVNHLNIFREDILNNIVQGIEPNLKEKEEPKDLKTTVMPSKKTRLIRLINEVPKFVGTDLNTYGPFEKEDVASLPEEIAALLITKNKAEEINQ